MFGSGQQLPPVNRISRWAVLLVLIFVSPVVTAVREGVWEGLRHLGGILALFAGAAVVVVLYDRLGSRLNVDLGEWFSRKSDARGYPLCAKCGYTLVTLTDGRKCPECGEVASDEDIWTSKALARCDGLDRKK